MAGLRHGRLSWNGKSITQRSRIAYFLSCSLDQHQRFKLKWPDFDCFQDRNFVPQSSLTFFIMNKQVLQDLMQNIEARKQTEQRLKATVRFSASLLSPAADGAALHCLAGRVSEPTGEPDSSTPVNESVSTILVAR